MWSISYCYFETSKHKSTIFNFQKQSTAGLRALDEHKAIKWDAVQSGRYAYWGRCRFRYLYQNNRITCQLITTSYRIHFPDTTSRFHSFQNSKQWWRKHTESSPGVCAHWLQHWEGAFVWHAANVWGLMGVAVLLRLPLTLPMTCARPTAQKLLCTGLHAQGDR